MVLSALLCSSGRFSPSRFSLVTCWTTPYSKVSGSNWKLPDRAAMCDVKFDATAAATLSDAIQARLFPLLPVTPWERNEAFASPPVASSGQPDPEARAGAGAATDSEDKVCVPLVDAMLEMSGAIATVLLVHPACESDLKGYVSIVFLPAPLVSAPTLPHLERFDGWMLGYFQDDVQATAASLLHWKSGFGIVDHFKTLVPGFGASSPDPVWKGMLKVKEDQRSTSFPQLVSCRFLRLDVPGQWTCSQCFAPRCWPVRERCYRCGAAREDLPVSSKGKGNEKGDIAVGPLGRKPPPTAGNVPSTTRRPQVVPPRGPPGAGVGSPPTPESPPSPPSEELVKALQLLQSALTPEDFSKYEKKLVPPKQQERVKLRERELLEAVERQANYEKEEQKHLEMIAEHEHNLAQQKVMLESVRSQLAEVRDTVGALRALVSETKEPPISSVVPPLPPPRETPPLDTVGILPTLGSAQDFLPLDTPCTIHPQYDLDTDMEDETGPVQSKSKKKRVLMKLKGSSSSVRRAKYESSSGKDLARALAKLSPGGMSEFVQSVPVNVAGSLMRFAAQSAPLRLWPTEYDAQDDVSNRGGPAAIEACG